MRVIRVLLIILSTFIFITSCTSNNENEIWIYTSLYKDTIADLKPLLEKDFPGVTVQFYQAGSEEIAAKVNAEILAGGTKADILISSDRFWYEEMAAYEKLEAYNTERVKQIPSQFRHKDGLYNTLSIPVMVLAYNGETYSSKTAPKTFKEMIDGKWNGKFSTGSPLASGTNFTTVAFLSKTYGWDFFKKLQNNGTISEGGNSAVLRRIQSKERPVGWVLLENLLRFQGKDKRLKTVFPQDGVVIHNNVLALTRKKGDRSKVKAIADWMFDKKGQDIMVKSYMYSPFVDHAAPKGAPPFKEIQKKAFPWTTDFVSYVVNNREKIKEDFSEIMFN